MSLDDRIELRNVEKRAEFLHDGQNLIRRGEVEKRIGVLIAAMNVYGAKYKAVRIELYNAKQDTYPKVLRYQNLKKSL